MDKRRGGGGFLFVGVVGVLGALVGSSPASAFELNVVNGAGVPVAGYRWMVEEDTTYLVRPGVRTNDIPALTVHGSYSPVSASGTATGSTATINVSPDKRYLVSVLPPAGYTLSGASVREGQTSVTVTVLQTPIQTAQVSVLVFHDHQPINSAPDIPTEAGLAGFTVTLSDALGAVSQDAFGNPLGTTYEQNADGSYVLDADGSPVVAVMGSGVILTNADGEALIKNLAPNKYAVRAVPPAGSDWVQTSTIEGTNADDAWVKPGEPPYLTEWGAASWHAFLGFLHPQKFAAPPAGTAVGTITGQAVYVHENRPPLQAVINPGVPVEHCWVGLNNLSGADEQVYAQPCGANSEFQITNVPPGTYQLVIWDAALDVIIDFRTVVVPPSGGLIALNQVAVYAWFGNYEGSVFNDLNRNGFRDEGETGIPGQTVLLRYLDGSIYKATVTDPSGHYAFPEVFPFFHFLTTEIDFARLDATGLTVVVDQGGVLAPGAKNTPQVQASINPNTGDALSRTETGQVLTQAFMVYAGQTNTIDWGKAPYPTGHNGGISGTVNYASTRAENDPRYAVADDWEPKIPRVQVNLYQDSNGDGVIDDLDGDGQQTLADVDNYPFGNFPQAEDVDRDGDGQFDPGDAIQIAHADSWDDSRPTGCPGQTTVIDGSPVMECAETLQTWNQVRPGVYDGAYAFLSYFPGGMASGSAEVEGLPNATYIVEAVPPPGYETVKEEDKNVDFGEDLIPALLPPSCVGDLHPVPAELTLFPGVPAPFANTPRPLCDRKQIALNAGQNAAVDFFVFTPVPKAGRIIGMALNDVQAEFNRSSPQYGTNFGVPWVPVAIKDFQGHELVRTYTDEWGHFNAIVPSTFSANRPTPTGYSPAMLVVCMNDPGPIPDPAHPGTTIRDPYYNPGYRQTCSTWDFMPGKTTMLDTPLLPIAAFSANRVPVDCEFPDGTPLLYEVNGPQGGPHVAGPGRQITLSSVGTLTIPNPGGTPTTLTRDYGFGGTTGQVTVNGVPLQINAWASDGSMIVATVPSGVTTGQLMVRRANGRTSEVGLTLWVGNARPVVRLSPGQSIQAAIDSSPNDALILVPPGRYKQNPIAWKNQALQGYGAFSTVIEAGPLSPEEQAAWDAKMAALIAAREVTLIDGERPTFYLESGAGITVAVRSNRFAGPRVGSIDGFGIEGAISGGGIFLNAWARNFTVSNNRLISNEGSFGGGIRVGTPSLVNNQGTGFIGSQNENVRIHHNHITQNGAIDGGGGVALFNGTTHYRLTDNFICGNYTLLYGGGIAHYGLSDDGEISRNKIVSNQSTDEGGGLIVAGELPPAEAALGTLTEGSGSVKVVGNLIQGNLAGDDGGGIRTLMVNGQDVQAKPRDPSRWHQIAILDNFIVNNSSADSGGGLSLDDTARGYIVGNTIARNDSTSTGVDAFGPCAGPMPPGIACPDNDNGGLTTSVPKAGGISANVHSTGLRAAFGQGYQQEYSNPVLDENVIWQNRSFYWDGAYNGGFGGLRPDLAVEAPVYFDLAVYNTATPQQLHPRYSVLTQPDGEPTNRGGDPRFLAPYVNVYQATSGGAMVGNFITTTFLPTGIQGDYHLGAGSSAVDIGPGLWRTTFPELARDYDGDLRGTLIDAGADERP